MDKKITQEDVATFYDINAERKERTESRTFYVDSELAGPLETVQERIRNSVFERKEELRHIPWHLEPEWILEWTWDSLQVVISWQRPETDKEVKQRLVRSHNAKVRKQAKEKQERAKRKKLYEQLKAEFEQ